MHERKYCHTIFLNELNDEVKVKLTLHLSESLSQMMDMVECIDSRSKMLLRAVLGGRIDERYANFARSFGPLSSFRRGIGSAVKSNMVGNSES